MRGNIIDLNLCLLVGQIGNDYKYARCSNGKEMATFSLCLNAFDKEFADATERTHSQTYIRVLCFDKKQIEYLRKVNAHQGQRAFVIARLTSFKNVYKGINYMSNGVVCRSITILKTSEDRQIASAMEMMQDYMAKGDVSERAYNAIMPLLGKYATETEEVEEMIENITEE